MKSNRIDCLPNPLVAYVSIGVCVLVVLSLTPFAIVHAQPDVGPAAEPVAQPISRDLDPYQLSAVTLAGSHNTYEKSSTFEYLYDALADVQVIELDIWSTADRVGGSWSVTHNTFKGRKNNCPKIVKNKQGTPEPGTRNQDLHSCMAALRYWHDANPNHPLVIVKFEMKNGFYYGTPSGLDSWISPYITPTMLFRPQDLMCKNPPSCDQTYDTLQAAAQANVWPKMDQLRGKFMFVAIPGTVSTSGPAQYASALAKKQASIIFPSLLLKSAKVDVDPRTSYFGSNASWGVMFDMQAGYIDAGSIPITVTQWMNTNHFLVFISDSTPACTPPNIARGNNRLAWLAANYHANVIDTDQETLTMTFPLPSTPAPATVAACPK